ncbi:MAG: hypothetical protein IKQ27_05655, partial [Lachnospiraceae bacterium]|nr:hypothetical protein [Lachnospiraceae bacterium]
MKLKTRLFIALVTIGVVLTVMGVRDWICLSKPVKDITDLWDYDYSKLKAGDHICLDVTLVWDQIGSHIEQHKTYGVTTSERETGRYYLIPFCQEEDEDFIYPTPFLLTSIPSRYNDAMDSQIKKFDAWWETDEDFDTVPTSSMHFDGKLVKIPNDLRKQIEENFLDPGERLEDYMLPVMFEPIINPGAAKGTTVAGIICLLISGVIVFVMFKGKSGNQNGFYGMPNAQKAGFIPQSANTTGAGFGGQQPQNMQGAFGAPVGGQQPQNMQGAFGAPVGGQQPQNMQGAFGAPVGGQQPQNMQGAFGAPMGGQQPQNMQG